MMKKFISLSLCLILGFIYIFPMNVCANNQFYSEQTEKLFDYLQTDYAGALQKNSDYEYIQFVNNFNSSWVSLYFLYMADYFADTGVEPDEEKYKEVLLNIIQTYDSNKSGEIANQKKLDNLKTFEDYGKDTVKIGAQAISTMSGISASTSQLEESDSMAVDGLAVLIDSTENWLDALSNLETVVQNYSYYSEFLKIVESNADGALKKAATSLKETLDFGAKIKLETYLDVTNENYERWGEEFFSDVFFSACKLTDEYENDSELRWFVNSGQNIAEKLEGLSDSWELGKMIGTLVGNLAVGGENLADRLMETMAIKDISEILSDNLQDMIIEQFHEIVGTEKEVDFVSKYVTISQFLIDCRIRGEYCWYSIISNDAGLLSWFNKETGKNANEVYTSLVNLMGKIQGELEKVLEKPSTIFENMPSEYIFTSGAGAWYTSITLDKDGSFTGIYEDSNIGDKGIGYEKGTTYICEFSGKFTNPKQIDSYTYSMNIDFLYIESEIGDLYYENNTRYIGAEPYGITESGEYLIYLPGRPMSESDLNKLNSYISVTLYEGVMPSNMYCICNSQDGSGFAGEITQ